MECQDYAQSSARSPQYSLFTVAVITINNPEKGSFSCLFLYVYAVVDILRGSYRCPGAIK